MSIFDNPERNVENSLLLLMPLYSLFYTLARTHALTHKRENPNGADNKYTTHDTLYPVN